MRYTNLLTYLLTYLGCVELRTNKSCTYENSCNGTMNSYEQTYWYELRGTCGHLRSIGHC